MLNLRHELLGIQTKKIETLSIVLRYCLEERRAARGRLVEDIINELEKRILGMKETA